MTKLIRGFLCLAEDQFEFVAKFDGRLLKHLSSGKNVRVVDVSIIEEIKEAD